MRHRHATLALTVGAAAIASLVSREALAQQPAQGAPGYPPGYPVPGQPAPAASPGGYPQGYPGAPGAAGAQQAPPDVPPEESEDSGLGLEWVYLNADAGFAYTDLASFSQTSLGLAKTAASGPTFGVGAGARLLFFSVGVRARDLILNFGNLWEIGGEAAFHIRVSSVDAYFGARGGYNFVGTLDSSTAKAATGDNQGVSIHGFDVGPMIGLDYYFSHLVSIGVDVDAQFLFIQRPKLALPSGVSSSMIPPQAQALYNESGSSAGIQVAPTAHLGIHF